MSVVLLVLGALSVVTGVGMLGFGIPVKEFSFGNTLILAGVTAIVGGFIVIGLGILAAQLQRVAEMLGARQLPRNARPLEPFELPAAEARSGQGSSRIPFPPKPRPEPRDQRALEPGPLSQPVLPGMTESHEHVPYGHDGAGPMLPNPDVAPDEAPLSPRQFPPMPGAPVRAAAETAEPMQPVTPRLAHAPAERDSASPKFEPAWRSPPPMSPRSPQAPAYFDAMWPTKGRAGPEPQPAPRAERIPRVGGHEPPALAQESQPAAASEARAIAILKSGVVDGMGYTLYVDGSIEAELPQGTARFASINELRAHLENNA